MVKWKTMWNRIDNQDVGSEAATIQRVRNSSLVQGFCAENVTGLKSFTEAAEYVGRHIGRGAFLKRRRHTGRSAGDLRSENAGMSMRKGR